jgi:mannose-6-phosphate isomerase-like protein (cupin superfamily)
LGALECGIIKIKGGSIMEKSKIVQPHEVKWEPHPQLANAKVAYFLSNREDNMDLSCFLVSTPVGTKIEKHIHENSDDIIFVVKGKAKMWIDKVGDVPLSEGSFIRIPKGVLHQPHDIEEDLIAYDVFYPYLI